MEVDQEHVQTLLSMGFPHEMDVRKALRLAKNSLNDAVAILTNDHPTTNFDTLDEIDVEMRDLAKGSTAPVYGPNLPPTYDEAVCSDVSWHFREGHFIKLTGNLSMLAGRTMTAWWWNYQCRKFFYS